MTKIELETGGSVWKLLVAEGDAVAALHIAEGDSVAEDDLALVIQA